MKSVWRWGFGDGSSVVFWGWLDSTIPSLDFVPVLVKGDFAPGVVAAGRKQKVSKVGRHGKFSPVFFSPGTNREVCAAKAVQSPGEPRGVVRGSPPGKAFPVERIAGIVRGRDAPKGERHVQKAKFMDENFKPKAGKR